MAFYKTLHQSIFSSRDESTREHLYMYIRKIDSVQTYYALTLFCLISFIFFSTEYLGQNIHVWGDEITYSMESRNLNLAGSTYPAYLYLALFSIVHKAGLGFLDFARSINSVLITASIVFNFFLAKIFLSSRHSLYLAAVLGFAPITTYVAYFMPDAMFYSSFCLYALITIKTFRISPLLCGLSAAASTCALSLIKPHGIFLLFAFLLAHFFYSLHSQYTVNQGRFIKIGASALLGFLVLRTGISYLTGASYSPFGTYSEWIEARMTFDLLVDHLKAGAFISSGHVFSIMLFVGPAFFAARVDTSIVNSERRFLSIFLTCNFLVLLLITILFSVRISDGATLTDSSRIHMRYYNFLIPLAIILYASSINHTNKATLFGKISYLLFSLVFVYFAFAGKPPFAFLPLDAPELSGLVQNPIIFSISSALISLVFFLCYFKASFAGKIFLYIAFPALTIASFFQVNSILALRLGDMIGDRAGRVTEQYFGNREKRIGYFGKPHEVNQALFWSGGKGSYTYFLDDNVPVPALDVDLLQPQNVSSIAKPVRSFDTNWILVFGERNVPSKYSVVLNHKEWKLYKSKSGSSLGPAFNLTDKDWIKGFSRTSAMFFVENSNFLRESFLTGRSVQFADGQLREIINVSSNGPYLNVFLEGPPLDGEKLGFPSDLQLLK